MNTMDCDLSLKFINTLLNSRVNDNGGRVRIQTRPLFCPTKKIIFAPHLPLEIHKIIFICSRDFRWLFFAHLKKYYYFCGYNTKLTMAKLISADLTNNNLCIIEYSTTDGQVLSLYTNLFDAVSRLFFA